MIAPTVQAAIEKAVDSAVQILRSTVLNDIIDSNSQLKNMIDQQTKLSEQQNKIIKEQAEQLQEKSQQIAELERKIENMSTELTKVKSSLNDVEQYGRRNSLRFSNLGLDPKLPEVELTKQVTFINDRMLVNGPILSESDIERCHPIGRPRTNSPSQIIVKFSSYHTKKRVFGANSRLRNSKMFVSEDLTRMKFSLVKKLQPLKKAGVIYSFWTSNGRIFSKKSEDGNPIRIYQAEDIEHRLG